ncbi:MAG: hypothetical protein AB1696_27750 [Planctomycetota bacterium]
MDVDAPALWPRSWPPFWQGVLHVAIAAGVTNMVALVSVVLEFATWELGFLLIAAIAVPILPPLLAGFLRRSHRQTKRALLTAFVLGVPIFVGGVTFPIGLLVIGWVFIRIARPANRRRVWLIMLLAALLLVLSVLLGGACEQTVVFRLHYHEGLSLALVTFSLISGITTTLAITAVLLTTTMGEHGKPVGDYSPLDPFDGFLRVVLAPVERILRWTLRIQRDGTGGVEIKVLKNGESKLSRSIVGRRRAKRRDAKVGP